MGVKEGVGNGGGGKEGFPNDGSDGFMEVNWKEEEAKDVGKEGDEVCVDEKDSGWKSDILI